MSDDRRQRDLELLRRSQKSLEDEQARRAAGEPEPAPRGSGTPGAPSGDDPNVRMYRGKPIRGGGGGTPGSGSGGAKAKQFRGAATGGRSQKPPDLKAVLERLNELYKDGLITKAEYDRKRLQILDRL